MLPLHRGAASTRHHRRGTADASGGIAREGAGFRIGLEDGHAIRADYVFLTTGHASGAHSIRDEAMLEQIAGLQARNPRLRFLPSAGALPELDAVDSSAKVLIC